MYRYMPQSCRAILAFAVLACGGGGDGTPTGPPSTDVVITLTSDLRFSPNDITIDPGTTIRWSSVSSEAHTVTPDNPAQAGVWARTESSAVGTVLRHTFSVSGQTYTYHCEPHLASGMTGTIRVR